MSSVSRIEFPDYHPYPIEFSYRLLGTAQASGMRYIRYHKGQWEWTAVPSNKFHWKLLSKEEQVKIKNVATEWHPGIPDFDPRS